MCIGKANILKFKNIIEKNSVMFVYEAGTAQRNQEATTPKFNKQRKIQKNRKKTSNEIQRKRTKARQ